VFYEAPHRIRDTLHEILAVRGDHPTVVARELTKLHEELVRGPISDVLARLTEPRGEFTVAIDLGEPTKKASPSDVLPDIAAEFWQLTVNGGLTRRQAIAALGKKHHVPTNQLYKAIEAARNK
jgi:16S rRNA (cytidine1402-2'-O)-methyltransferase